jgi:DNA-binding winged helix-turn-helix (wHTH) protein
MPGVSRYRFGGFVLDQGTRQLLDDGRDVHVSPKAFELLTILIANRGRVMPKTELQERLWPSTFVEETNLAGLVAEIRRALRDPAIQPVFIQTKYRFGYRFVGDVTEDGAMAAAPARSQAPNGKLCLVFQNRETLLQEGANVIGRAPDATIQCVATGVSRHHARIVVSNGEATLEDLASKNGTYLGRQRITSVRLSNGDELRLGRVSMTFRIEPSLGPTETVASESQDRRR